MLPSSRRGGGGGLGGLGGKSGQRRLWSFLRRVGRVGQMDFEVAAWQVLWLLIGPRRVYRHVYYHKQTKNQWARDDPAFLVLLCAALLLAALLYAFAFRASLLHTLRLMTSFVVVDLLLSGVVVASASWWFANRFLRVQAVHSVEQKVEWAYAFDIHCNAFVPVFFLLFLLQFFCMPLLLKDNFFALFFANSLYLAAFVYYSFISFLGYSALPFLQRTVVFLYPILFYVIFYVASLFLVNLSKFFLGLYFPL